MPGVSTTWTGPLLDLLFEESSVGRCLVAPDSSVLRANAEWLRSTGFSLDDVLGANIIDLFPQVRDMALAMHARARAGHRVDVPRHAQRIQGRDTWWEGHIEPVPMEGGIGLLITNRLISPEVAVHSVDVAERGDYEVQLRSIERALKDIIDSSPSIIFLKDADGRFITINKQLEDLLGISRGELKGKTDFDIFPKDRAEYYRAHDRRVLESGQAFQVEEVADLADGKRHVFLANKFPLRDALGQIYGTCGISHDITERKAATEALNQLNVTLEARVAERTEALAASEHKFRSIFENSTDAIILAVPGRQVTAANPAACAMFGMTEEELCRAGREGIEDPADPRHSAAVEERARTGTVKYEGTHIRKDGSRFPSEVGSVIMDGGSRSLVIIRDITERKRAEEALRKSERLYRAIGESIDYGVWVCSADGRNTYASESFLKLVGITQQQCSEFGWGEVLHPDDAARTIAAWQECVRTGGNWDIEHRFRGTDGRWHPVLARGVPVKDERGEITCWAGINLDVSRLKQTQEDLRDAKQRLESLLENSPLAVVEWSSVDYRIARWSDEATKVFGWTAGETVGKRIDELAWIYPEDRPLVEQVMADMLSDKRPRTVNRNRNVRKDGSVIHCEWYNSTLHDPSRGFSVLSLVLDVTEQKHAEETLRRAEQALRDANEQLNEADRRKDEFLAVLSHELRNPLAPIRNSVHMLHRAPAGSDTARRAREVLQRQTDHLTRLVDDLLDLTRISHGRIELQPARIDARDVARRACDDIRTVFEQRSVELRYSQPTEPAWVDADAARLAQMVGNLVTNALKFTQSGGHVKVAIRTKGHACEISVRDTGMGIEPADLERIFEPFVQAGRAHPGARSGLGIGLALVKDLTVKHGGSVRAESEGLGKGAEFVLTLPLTAAPTDITSRVELGESISGLSVLVVEDNEDAGLSLADLLGLTGHQVEVVGTGRAGIEAVSANAPDVLICDVGLPDLSGYEVVRTLRMAGSRVFAIALTGFAQPQDREQALEAGFDAHLAKPPALDRLNELMAEAARKKR
jgi:PAS domain S-box-containing protein